MTDEGCCDNIEFLPRGRAVAARRAHNPEVAGSSPVPATDMETTTKMAVVFVCLEATTIKILILGLKGK